MKADNAVPQAEAKHLIEPHLQEELNKEAYDVRVINPRSMLTWNRLDVAFKLIYLECRNICEHFAREIYGAHIHALTLGRDTEPGNRDKNSIDKFITAFDEILANISALGFDTSMSLIPQAKDGSIVNGAHRVAAAIHSNKDIVCINLESTPHIYDHQFFYNRRMKLGHIEAAVTKFIESADNVYIAMIWPSAVGRDHEVNALIPNIVYRKEVKLNARGARNLLIKVYHSEAWLGNVENKFKGVDGKLVECFRNFNSVRVFAFQAASLEEVLSIKQKIRDIYNIGKHSIHITDTQEESVRLSRWLFNGNSIHFLNHADPYKYTSTHLELNKLKRFIEQNHLNARELLVDSGFLLSLYGIRESMDIDYLALESGSIMHPIDGINNHNEEVRHHAEDLAMLINNPLFYFYYDDVKLISFAQLYRMKKNRAEEKDLNDLALMNALLTGNKFMACTSRLKQHFYYTKVKCKCKTIEVLQKLGIYSLVKAIYKWIK